MGVLLVFAVVAPLGAAAVALAVPERAVVGMRIGCLVTAACWFVLLLDGSLVSVSHIHSVPLVAAAGLGAALVGASVDGTKLERPALVGIALAGASLAVAAGRTHTDGAGLLAAAVIAAAAANAAGRPAVREEGPAALALLVAGIGVVALRSAANSWQLPAVDGLAHRGDGLFVFLGATLLVLAGAQRTRAAVALLVPVGAFLAAQAAPMVRGTSGGGLASVAVLLAVLAAVASVAMRAGRPLVDRTTAALLLLSLAALVSPGVTRSAALLLAAGGVLAAALGWDSAAVLGVPGAIAFAVALAGHGGATAFVVGLFMVVVAVALAAGGSEEQTRPPAWGIPAAAAGAWLLVAPATWAWVGPVGLHPYDTGAARAVAGAGLCLAVLALMGRIPTDWYARAFSPDPPGEDAVRH